MNLKNKNSRSNRGAITIELAIVALLLVVFSVLVFNLVIVLWGYSILDQVARNSCRAAAATSSASDGLKAAQQTARAYNTDGYFVTQPKIVPADFQFVTNPNGTNPPSGSPFVVVTARNTIRLPVPISFFGAKMQDGMYSFGRSYTYPILGVP
ncbi:MAG: hypothetical protein K2X93_27500, partial [Candidatus Obscuribacterales bacterium]|nr:hypothetical protein [Candidatus Obscuribacterales bacterium]